MVISQNDSIEFVVNESAFLCLKQRQYRVESLYNVSVRSDSIQGELRWVKVIGEERLRMKAKEYITAMGKPECEKLIEIGASLPDETDFDEFVFDLEKECSANITHVDKGFIRVSGSAVSVARVESYLGNMISNNQTDLSELPAKRARLESSSSCDTASLNDELSAFDEVEGLLGSLREDDLQYEALECGVKENIDPMSQETSEDFAAKLGYSKDLYALAVKKVGKDADRNDLLNELVKLKNSKKELNEEPLKVSPDRRFCSFVASKQLRPIIIDGSNVAMSHGKQKFFSCRGIKIVVDWFIPRGHKSIYVVLPCWRKESPSENNVISDHDVLKILEAAAGVSMVYTPSKKLEKRRFACHDDRYILEIAFKKDGVVVSNDNFRDLYLDKEKPEWRKIIEERVLMYSFVDDTFMPPDDPHGRNGPHIDELLSFGSSSKTKVCHYGRKCSYGQNCKYAHPERDESVLREPPSMAPRPYSEPLPLADTNALCEKFKCFSLPDLNRNQQPPPLVARSRPSSSPLPPAIPSRRPQQARAPALPPRSNGNGMRRGLQTTNENPYAPMPVDQAQMMQYIARQQQQPRLPPRRHPHYDTLPFSHSVMAPPPHTQHHQYYNVPPTAPYMPNNTRRGRGGPYDNLPPDGQVPPVYPPRNHAIYQHNFYRSRAPPADDSDEDLGALLEENTILESEQLRGISRSKDSRLQTIVS